MTVSLPKYLDASLIQVDSHPTYITIVVKGKVLRLRFPEEVNSDAGTAKRSATTGDLVITLPHAVRRSTGARAVGSAGGDAADGRGDGAGATAASQRTRRLAAPQKLADALLEESKAVSVAGIVRPKDEHMKEVKSRTLAAGAGTTAAAAAASTFTDDDDVPPLE